MEKSNTNQGARKARVTFGRLFIQYTNWERPEMMSSRRYLRLFNRAIPHTLNHLTKEWFNN